MEKLHLIAGLPRSGSTLLSSILNQNPRFHAGISDPLNETVCNMVSAFSVIGSHTQCTEEQKISSLQGFIEGYYKHIKKPVVFNSSRYWTGSLHLMHLVRPESKVICCVRDIPWILDSLELLYKNSPTLYAHSYTTSHYNEKTSSMLFDVYKRTDSHFSLVLRNLNSMKEGFFSPYRNKMMFVEYEYLAREPQKIMKQVYKFLDEPYFKHNFNDVEVSYDEFDLAVQQKGLHTIRKKVEFIEREPNIPPDIWAHYSCGHEFWRDFTSERE